MKKLNLTLFLIFLFFSSFSIFSQYTNVINSNRPGFSESPYSVGTGIYQFENSIFFKNTSIEPTFTIPQSLGVDLLFRTSFFFEKLELNTQLTFQRDKVAFKNIFTSHYFSTGLSRMTVGAKYLVYEQKYTDKSKEIRSWKRRNAFDLKRLIPSVAVYAGANLDFINDIHKTGSISPKVGVLLQNDLSYDFNLVTNIFYDNIGTDFSEFSYIVTGTYSFNERWSTFFESQGIFQKYRIDNNLGTGVAFLYTPNLQINASFRGVFEGDATGFYTGLGVSYRINRHRDSYKELDENGNEIKDKPKTRRRGGNFFSRIFSIFKKKEKGIRYRPKRNRKKLSKNKGKKEKKGFFGLFGKKKSEEENEDEIDEKEETEEEKLEREIKELEKDIEKEDENKEETETEKLEREIRELEQEINKDTKESETQKLEREIKELEEKLLEEDKSESEIKKIEKDLKKLKKKLKKSKKKKKGFFGLFGKKKKKKENDEN